MNGRTDNTVIEWSKEKGQKDKQYVCNLQSTTHNTNSKDWATQTSQKTGNSGAPEGWAVPDPLVSLVPVVLSSGTNPSCYS